VQAITVGWKAVSMCAEIASVYCGVGVVGCMALWISGC